MTSLRHVGYENILLTDLAEDAKYYFTPEGNALTLQLFSIDNALRKGDHHFVDHYGLNDRFPYSTLLRFP